jgi:hypothetical protein
MKNNRDAGHSYERTIRQWFRALGWKDCQTSRYASREMDDKKVDLVGTEPLYVQCKYTQTINMHKVLGEMPQTTNLNVVFHKRKNQGTVVAMGIKDFEEIIVMLRGNGIL